jgi:hypothetical protein
MLGDQHVAVNEHVQTAAELIQQRPTQGRASMPPAVQHAPQQLTCSTSVIASEGAIEMPPLPRPSLADRTAGQHHSSELGDDAARVWCGFPLLASSRGRDAHL